MKIAFTVVNMQRKNYDYRLIYTLHKHNLKQFALTYLY